MSFSGGKIGRGQEAVEDMRNRLRAGWSVGELWDRFSDAVSGKGFSYEYAELDNESKQVA